ncbi:hemerythrin domain-containing protein [Nonomuraea sp. NPDC004354]
MSITDYFTHSFRAEHRRLRDLLLSLVDAFRSGDTARVRTLVSCVSAAAGPSFRYEEEAMYPGLVPIVGREHVAKLFTDHDGAIRELRELNDVSRAAELDTERGIRLTRALLRHVSDSDGLALMAEVMPEDDVVHILASRDAVVERDLDVLAWADQVRGGRV